ncbi:MAG: DUF1566 domain-containing protein, partial [Polyangiaceae bacterium]|nr:DUF1566 domain-containing protein [Polyangiaceae bacterium]
RRAPQRSHCSTSILKVRLRSSRHGRYPQRQWSECFCGAQGGGAAGLGGGGERPTGGGRSSGGGANGGAKDEPRGGESGALATGGRSGGAPGGGAGSGGVRTGGEHGGGEDSGGAAAGGVSGGVMTGGATGSGGAAGNPSTGGTGGSCTEGASCVIDSQPCRRGELVCLPTPTCSATGELVPNGNECGSGRVCNNGACVQCSDGDACDPGMACHTGFISCVSGTPECVVDATDEDGTSCGTDLVCNNGSCDPCEDNVACEHENPCQEGVTSCSTGVSVCEASFDRADGFVCNGTDYCRSVVCVDAEWAQWPIPSPVGSTDPNPSTYTPDAYASTATNEINGLEWSEADATTWSWSDALDHCATYETAGIHEWRLPTVMELISIFDYTRSDGTPTAIWDTTVGAFWTATEVYGATDQAWTLTNAGRSTATAKAEPHLVRCVRTNSSEGSSGGYVVETETVIDQRAGLEWSRTTTGPIGRSLPPEHCAEQTAAGGGWRAPTIIELRSLVDVTRASPAIDLDAFPDTQSGRYWSATNVHADDAVYYVDFTDGRVGSSDSSTAYVRCVR